MASDHQRWLSDLSRTGAATRAALAAVDEAFDHLYETMRAARQSGCTVPHIVEVTGISKAQVDNAIARTGPVLDLPHSDIDLRTAAYRARTADAEYLAARGRRDILILRAGVSPDLQFKQIAEAVGIPRRVEWEIRTGRLGLDRKSPRQDAFEGAGVDGWRATENEALRQRRHGVRTGAYEVKTHGLHGYKLGCRCETCVAARKDVEGGRTEIKHGVYGYTLGCRCDECREAKTTYNRQWRQRRESGRKDQ